MSQRIILSFILLIFGLGFLHAAEGLSPPDTCQGPIVRISVALISASNRRTFGDKNLDAGGEQENVDVWGAQAPFGVQLNSSMEGRLTGRLAAASPLDACSALDRDTVGGGGLLPPCFLSWQTQLVWMVSTRHPCWEFMHACKSCEKT